MADVQTSKAPKDIVGTLVGPLIASPVFRDTFHLGAFSANATAAPDSRFLADRKLYIREMWVSGDAIPSDLDGTMLLNALVNDISEGADDTIVSSANMATLILAANKAYKLSFADETTERQRTIEAGDTVRWTLVNNSAAINTNSKLTVTVLWQPLVKVA